MNAVTNIGYGLWGVTRGALSVVPFAGRLGGAKWARWEMNHAVASRISRGVGAALLVGVGVGVAALAVTAGWVAIPAAAVAYAGFLPTNSLALAAICIWPVSGTVAGLTYAAGAPTRTRRAVEEPVLERHTEMVRAREEVARTLSQLMKVALDSPEAGVDVGRAIVARAEACGLRYNAKTGVFAPTSDPLTEGMMAATTREAEPVTLLRTQIQASHCRVDEKEQLLDLLQQQPGEIDRIRTRFNEMQGSEVFRSHAEQAPKREMPAPAPFDPSRPGTSAAAAGSAFPEGGVKGNPFEGVGEDEQQQLAANSDDNPFASSVGERELQAVKDNLKQAITLTPGWGSADDEGYKRDMKAAIESAETVEEARRISGAFQRHVDTTRRLSEQARRAANLARFDVHGAAQRPERAYEMGDVRRAPAAAVDTEEVKAQRLMGEFRAEAARLAQVQARDARAPGHATEMVSWENLPYTGEGVEMPQEEEARQQTARAEANRLLEGLREDFQAELDSALKLSGKSGQQVVQNVIQRAEFFGLFVDRGEGRVNIVDEVDVACLPGLRAEANRRAYERQVERDPRDQEEFDAGFEAAKAMDARQETEQQVGRAVLTAGDVTVAIGQAAVGLGLGAVVLSANIAAAAGRSLWGAARGWFRQPKVETSASARSVDLTEGEIQPERRWTTTETIEPGMERRQVGGQLLVEIDPQAQADAKDEEDVVSMPDSPVAMTAPKMPKLQGRELAAHLRGRVEDIMSRPASEQVVPEGALEQAEQALKAAQATLSRMNKAAAASTSVAAAPKKKEKKPLPTQEELAAKRAAAAERKLDVTVERVKSSTVEALMSDNKRSWETINMAKSQKQSQQRAAYSQLQDYIMFAKGVAERAAPRLNIDVLTFAIAQCEEFGATATSVTVGNIAKVKDLYDAIAAVLKAEEQQPKRR